MTKKDKDLRKPYDYMKERKDNLKYYTNIADAEEVFKSQLDSLDKITWTKWYQNIKNFFIAQLNEWIMALQEVDTDKTTELARIQWRVALSKKFLDYLDAREK